MHEFVLNCPLTGDELSPDDIAPLESKSPIIYRMYSGMLINCIFKQTRTRDHREQNNPLVGYFA